MPLIFSIALALSGHTCPEQHRVLAEVSNAIRRDYFDAQAATQIADAVEQWAAKGRYASACGDSDAFLEQINRDLDAYDGHFLLSERNPSAAQDDWLMAWRADAHDSNAGIREVRVLEGNIGYLRMSTFYSMDLIGNKLSSAFALLADTDALILDLRSNGGGHDESANALVSAFLKPGLKSVQNIQTRQDSRMDELPPSTLPHYTKPLAILVDRRTASAAEFVAYTLQSYKRAKIVGSRSAGAANMLGDAAKRIGDFELHIPEARPVNHKTRSNWEGTGVAPDMPGGDDALFVARRFLDEAGKKNWPAAPRILPR